MLESATAQPNAGSPPMAPTIAPPSANLLGGLRGEIGPRSRQIGSVGRAPLGHRGGRRRLRIRHREMRSGAEGGEVGDDLPLPPLSSPDRSLSPLVVLSRLLTTLAH